MKKPKKKPILRLTEEDSSVFAIMAGAIVALMKAGADEEYIRQYKKEAMSGDYDNLMRVTKDYVSIE